MMDVDVGKAITSAMQDQRWRDQRTWFGNQYAAGISRLDRCFVGRVLIDWNWRW